MIISLKYVRDSALHKDTITIMASLSTLPVPLIYIILDNLTPIDTFYAMSSVSVRLDAIIHSYRPYQVNIDALL